MKLKKKQPMKKKKVIVLMLMIKKGYLNGSDLLGTLKKKILLKEQELKFSYTSLSYR